MARIALSKRHLAVIAALTASAAVTACYAASIHARTSTHLQEIADNAALAGVNALAASTGQPADARSAAAVTAAQSVATGQSSTIRALQASADGLTMSVVMEDADKGTQVSATARYIPAKDSRPARQAINMPGPVATTL
jgi:phosphotransferase system HPr-like phosphotransfer protein